MNRAQLFSLYNTMVLPHLQYCLINWGNFKGDRNMGLGGRLLTLQKSLIRIICGAHRISHTDPLFADLGALKIDELYAQTVRIFSYKLFRGLLPSGVAVHFPKVKHGYRTRGASNNLFVSRSDHRSLKSIAPRVWNNLHLQLKQSTSISSFKNQSKRGLLAPYALFACDGAGCRSCGNPG